MKKIYMIPTTQVVKIHTVNMIAASEYVPIGDNVETAAGAESRRRGFSIWGDDNDCEE